MSARFSLTDLEILIGATSDRDIAQATDSTRRTVQRWRHQGLSARQADRAAVRAGFHPANIWPHWYRATTTGP